MSWFESVYSAQELPHRARAVYMYLRDRADAEGKCWPGVKRIAADLRLSRRTTQRALSDLENAGLLLRDSRYRENGSRTSNLYMLK
jgi:DNA-binding MarR family transcriptional regulator